MHDCRLWNEFRLPQNCGDSFRGKISREMRSGNLQAGEELIQQREREEKGGNVASVELLPSNEKEGRGKHETARDDSLLTRDVQTVDVEIRMCG